MAQKLEEVSCVLHQINDDLVYFHPILLSSIGTRSLRQNEFFKVLLKLMRYVFTTRVIMKFFYTILKLSFNICKKFLKHRKHFRFKPKKIYLSKTIVIINKRDKIFIMSMRNYMRHLKTSGSTTSTTQKRKCFTFIQFTN